MFDDWKLSQARSAILLYREQHGISAPIWGSISYLRRVQMTGQERRGVPDSFQTADRMAFWRKDAHVQSTSTGGTRTHRHPKKQDPIHVA